MMKIQKILNDSFKNLEDAMGGDKDLAHFYKSLIGVCMQAYALDVLDDIEEDMDSFDAIYSKVEKEVWE